MRNAAHPPRNNPFWEEGGREFLIPNSSFLISEVSKS
jgi:hypothetical protein